MAPSYRELNVDRFEPTNQAETDGNEIINSEGKENIEVATNLEEGANVDSATGLSSKKSNMMTAKQKDKHTQEMGL